jgi:hypothetical protein
VVSADSARWNHNIHYQPLTLSAVPAGPRTALAVGCGEGMLTRRLPKLVPLVVGIESDQVRIELARSLDSTGSIAYMLGDFTDCPIPTSLVRPDHLDRQAPPHARGLGAHPDAQATQPGSTLAIIGLARNGIIGLPFELARTIATRLHTHRKGYWNHPSPIVWPPPLSYRQMQHIAAE